MIPEGEFRVFQASGRDASGLEPWGAESRGFMQTPFWAAFKSSTGWKALVCRHRWNESGIPRCQDILVLQRSLGFGMDFLYVPFGPEDKPSALGSRAYLEALGAAFAASGSRAAFLRFDLPWELSDHPDMGELSANRGLRRGQAVQVPDTVVIELTPTEDELLGAMKPKWRYNIRLAEKRGVEVRRGGAPDALDTFYGLYRETASRDGIAIHPLSYYARLFETARASPESDKAEAVIFTAYHEGEALASIIVLAHRARATYLYGASSSKKRSLMPAYALQWEAMLWAKRHGCRDYDLFGIPPDDSPDHPMAGLYLFKTGFGGRIVHRAGAFDLPLRPLRYAAFTGAEKLRLFWHKKLKKRVAKALRSGKGSSPGGMPGSTPESNQEKTRPSNL